LGSPRLGLTHDFVKVLDFGLVKDTRTGVAYYMLTGRQVFEAQHLFHMISRHLNDTPVPPSQVTDRFIEPGLERLVLACLAKNPDDRPAGALELARLLEQVPVEPWDEAHAASWWELAGAGPDR
jgi:serine/threonine-protein kinase